jgi:hypothetical protein
MQIADMALIQKKLYPILNRQKSENFVIFAFSPL